MLNLTKNLKNLKNIKTTPKNTPLSIRKTVLLRIVCLENTILLRYAFPTFFGDFLHFQSKKRIVFCKIIAQPIYKFFLIIKNKIK
mgnify:CR=1 FL=1